jgi:integrase
LQGRAYLCSLGLVDRIIEDAGLVEDEPTKAGRCSRKRGPGGFDFSWLHDTEATRKATASFWRTPDPFTLAEIDAIAAELGTVYGPLVRFAAATGLRPQEWAALERRDVDRPGRVVNVRRTVADGVVRDLAKTDASRRQVPLSERALAALDAMPPRLDTPLLFPAQGGGPLNLDNWRQREWAPSFEASGVRKRRIYDLRSTFISHALAAGISVFELAKVAGTSVHMIERHYGALLDGSAASIAARLDRAEAALEKAAEDEADKAEK